MMPAITSCAMGRPSRECMTSSSTTARCRGARTRKWIGMAVNTWDYYEFKHDGSTHLVKQAQYDAAKPFSVPQVSLHPVSDLLDHVLPGVGASKPSRDAVDQRIVKSVRDKTGMSQVAGDGPWPDLAA